MKSQIKYNKFLTKQQGEKYERRSKSASEIESTSFAMQEWNRKRLGNTAGLMIRDTGN